MSSSFLETSDVAIKQLIEDTQELINDKMETLSRLVSILQFLEKIKHEVDTLVLCTVRETVEKIKNQTILESRECTPINNDSLISINEEVVPSRLETFQTSKTNNRHKLKNHHNNNNNQHKIYKTITRSNLFLKHLI